MYGLPRIPDQILAIKNAAHGATQAGFARLQQATLLREIGNKPEAQIADAEKAEAFIQAHILRSLIHPPSTD